MDKSCNAVSAVAFVRAHVADSEILAKQISVPTENILGLAAHESQWGVGRFAVQGNNYFSMHAPAPMQSGTMHAKGDAKLLVATYESFYRCGQSFIARFGNSVKGKEDPKEFSEALVSCGYNSGNSKTGGSDGYAKKVESAILMVKRRESCLASR